MRKFLHRVKKTALQFPETKIFSDDYAFVDKPSSYSGVTSGMGHDWKTAILQVALGTLASGSAYMIRLKQPETAFVGVGAANAVAATSMLY